MDYKLLLTFAAFFVFAGNLARIDAVKGDFERGCGVFAAVGERCFLSGYEQRADCNAPFPLYVL